MTRTSDRYMTSTRPRGRRRAAIIGLAVLLATLIAVPSAAPIVGTAAIILMVWGVWSRPADRTEGLDTTAQREPILWDDGFGAT